MPKDDYQLDDTVQQPVRASDAFGIFQTVASVPVNPPRNFLDQIQFYSNSGTYRLYMWDNTGATWHYVALT